MGNQWRSLAIWIAMLSPSLVFAQQACQNGARVDGTVTDPDGAVIPGAQIETVGSEKTSADASGHFLLPCVLAASNRIMARAEGFTSGEVAVNARAGGSIHLNIKLQIANVETAVEVSADTDNGDRGAGTTTLTAREVQILADDPDDFFRQLQALSGSGGADPASTRILVDGFQNGSALPPKGSIASIRINPDLFSSEYTFPPFDGGLIEIATKPGADSFHGSLFFSDSHSLFNASNPFSASATPASKRRYGGELSGPVLSRKGGFALSFEKRDIDEFNIVNAVTLNAKGEQTPFRQTVLAPQRLWIASARSDWQLGSRDTAALSFSSNLNDRGNQGIGGLTLAEAGYSSVLSEHDLRFTNMLTLNPNTLHQTRIGYSWKRTKQSALSTAPSLQVSGFFTGGGATDQNLNDRERDLEVDDDLLLTRGRHQLKIGVQSLGIFEHGYVPNNFNGTYVFGGGSAPVLDANNNPTTQTTTISSLEQYRRAKNNLAGGTPTTYQLTSGTPVVPVTQWHVGMYVQDAIKLAPRLTANLGFRYTLQTSPDSYANFGPRLSLSWSPDKKETWVFRARVGLFSAFVNRSYAIEAARLNGLRQQRTTIYSPSYLEPLVPVAGSIKVATVQTFPGSFSQPSTFAGYFNMEHEIAGHWILEFHYYLGQEWNLIRTKNINAPMVASSVGHAPNPAAALLSPRPIAPNENILQFQNSVHFTGNVISFVVDQHHSKFFGLRAYYVHRASKTNGGSGSVTPQSSYSDAGESSRANWASTNGFFMTGNLNLPYRLALSTQFAAQQGTPYNITTGTDNNGDGTFNDRPAFASALGAGVYDTHFGLLTANSVNGDVPRNLGTMPTLIHMDMNLSRTFRLNPADKEHQRTLTLNARSANLLNHTNVTAVQTVLSPTLGQPLSAETARRVELGMRFSF